MKRTYINLTTCLLILLVVIYTNKSFAQVDIPDITGVKDIELNLACKVILMQGEISRLEIKGDFDDLEDITARVIGNRLVIKNYDRFQYRRNVQIKLTVPDLRNLSITGSVKLETPSPVFYKNLDIDVSGVADFVMRLKSNDFKIDVSGVIHAELIGETTNMSVDISGVGKLNADSFRSEYCDIEVSGLAKADVYATETLRAEVSGLGSINYEGNPHVRKSSSGLGFISKL